MFFLLYKHTNDGVFHDFTKISGNFKKLFRRSDERWRKFSNMSEDFRRLPKTFEEVSKVFQ